MVSIKETRNKLADIINQVSVAGDVFVVTKFGQPKAMIVPISQAKAPKPVLQETFGAWKERRDIKDTAKWVAKLRGQMNVRK